MENGAKALIAVILAAGLATRFGSCKQIAKIDGKPMIGHVLDSLPEDIPKFVITGAYQDQVVEACRGQNCKFVENKHYRLGMSSSIRLAAQIAEQESDDLLLTLCDLPYVHQCDYQHLLKQFGGETLFSRFQDSASREFFGPPAIFPKSTLAILTQLGDGERPKRIFPKARSIVIENAGRDVDYPLETSNSIAPVNGA